MHVGTGKSPYDAGRAGRHNKHAGHDRRKAGPATVCRQPARDSRSRVNVAPILLIFHRARIQPPVGIGSCDRSYIFWAWGKKLVREIGAGIIVWGPGPDALSFRLELSLAHHPRPKERGVSRLG